MQESLPRFEDKDDDGETKDKSYKVPGTLQLKEIIEYLFQTLKVKDHLLISESDKSRDNLDPCDYIELVLKTPKGSMEQDTIVLDNQLVLHCVFNYLYT